MANEVAENYALETIKAQANKAYLALSKKELEFQQDLKLGDDDVYYPTELLNSGKAGAVLKPFVFEQDGQQGYMIVRINAVNPVRAKTFEEARAEILPLYKLQTQKEALAQKASKALANFKGKNIGSVSRDSARNDKLVDEKLMNDAEFAFFLMNVFNANDSKGFVLFDDKAVLYSIKGQNLLSTNKLNAYKDKLAQDVRNIKANEIKKELLTRLKGKYKVEIYYEKDKS